MRTKLFTGLLAAALVSSGCVLVADGGGGGTTPGTGDLEIFYTFGAQSHECDQVGVSTISVRVAGVTTRDGHTQSVSCAEFRQGIRIDDLATGDYDLTIQGLDAANYLVYETAAALRITVVRDTLSTYTANLVSTAPPVGDLSVYWDSFGGHTSCAAAGVTHVWAGLYDASEQLLNGDGDLMSCENAGVIWDDVTVGTYGLVLEAQDANGTVLYDLWDPNIHVNAGDNVYELALVAMPGDLLISYTFEGSGSCGDVTDVQAIVYAPNGEVWDQTYACVDGGGIAYDDIPAGVYTVHLRGLVGTAVEYDSGEVDVDVFPGQSIEHVINLFW